MKPSLNCLPKAGELSGRLALDHQPLDNWAHHALAHNFEESGRAGQGSAFLANTEEQWSQGENFSLHLHWHQALLHLQLGEIEETLALYDDTIGPRAKGGHQQHLNDQSTYVSGLKDLRDKKKADMLLFYLYLLHFGGKFCQINSK